MKNFYIKKIYLSPSASVSGERNGMHGKGYLLKGHKVSEETKKKLSIKASLRRHTEEEKRNGVNKEREKIVVKKILFTGNIIQKKQKREW